MWSPFQRPHCLVVLGAGPGGTRGRQPRATVVVVTAINASAMDLLCCRNVSQQIRPSFVSVLVCESVRRGRVSYVSSCRVLCVVVCVCGHNTLTPDVTRQNMVRDGRGRETALCEDQQRGEGGREGGSEPADVEFVGCENGSRRLRHGCQRFGKSCRDEG